MIILFNDLVVYVIEYEMFFKDIECLVVKE